MRRILELLTFNRYIAILTGIIVTMLVQSSSATTVMVVGFVNAGLMDLSRAVGTILGANIGTTITAQIVAFKNNRDRLAGHCCRCCHVHIHSKTGISQPGPSYFGIWPLFLGISIMGSDLGSSRTTPALSTCWPPWGNTGYWACWQVCFYRIDTIQQRQHGNCHRPGSAGRDGPGFCHCPGPGLQYRVPVSPPSWPASARTQRPQGSHRPRPL